MSPDLAKALAKVIEAPYDGIGARIRELSYAWMVKGLKIRGNFYYLALRDGAPTVDEFVGLLYDHLAYFCLPRKDRDSFREQYEATNHLRHLQAMFDKARKLLIRSAEAKKTLGEPGEIILFLLLEGLLKAPQMCCKMSLKTSEEMPVHGSDAIHMSFDAATDTLTLFWGESKLYSELSKALDEACDSIKHFNRDVKGKKPRDRDVSILCDNMNVEDKATKEAILKYFNRYEEASNNLREVHACFVGFDFNDFKKLADLDTGKAQAEFEKCYLARIKSACGLFESKIKSKNLHELNFHFFLIPFPCVQTLRDLFAKQIGG